MKLMFVAGSRPYFIITAHLPRACQAEDIVESVLLHTWQHYRYGEIKHGRIPDLWDGRTAKLILGHLVSAESAFSS